MAFGISQLENRNWTFKQNVTVEGDLTIEGDITFGDAASDTAAVAGDLRINDDRFLHFGTDEDVSIEYDENGIDTLLVTGAAWAITPAVSVTGVLTGGTVTDGTFSTTAGAISGVTTLAMGGALSGVTTLAASGDITLTTAGVVSSVSNAMMGWYLAAAQQVLAGAGVVTLTEYNTTLDTTAGAAAITLANSTIKGQLKRIQLIVDGGDATLTPTTLNGGTTITFADVGDCAELIWDGSGWQVIALYNLADGATAPVLA